MGQDIDLVYIKTNILSNYKNTKGALIPVLQEVQNHYTYVPEPAVDIIAEALNVSLSEIYGVLTFYTQFYTQPEGKYTIKLCRGTACHVKGSKSILEAIERKLGIHEGETTPDRLFTLRIVACLGACAVAPVMMINEDYYGELTPEKTDAIFTELLSKECKETQTRA